MYAGNTSGGPTFYRVTSTGRLNPVIGIGTRREWRRLPLGELGRAYTGLTGKSKADFHGHGSPFIPYLNVFSNSRIEMAIKSLEAETVAVARQQTALMRRIFAS